MQYNPKQFPIESIGGGDVCTAPSRIVQKNQAMNEPV